MSYYTREAFINKFGGYANTITDGTGIFPEIQLAVAILESSKKIGSNYFVGASQLANKYNNFFGIKDSTGWNGKTVNLSTGEIVNNKPVTIKSNFRVYDSAEDSFKDFIRFLQVNQRYRKFGVFDSKGVIEQAKNLQAAGYATDPEYSKKLISIAEKIKGILPEKKDIVIPIILMVVGGWLLSTLNTSK